PPPTRTVALPCRSMPPREGREALSPRRDPPPERCSTVPFGAAPPSSRRAPPPVARSPPPTTRKPLHGPTDLLPADGSPLRARPEPATARRDDRIVASNRPAVGDAARSSRPERDPERGGRGSSS